MWRWAVLWLSSTLLLVGGTFDLRLFHPRRQLGLPPEVNCYEYSMNTDALGRTFVKGLRTVKRSVNNEMAPTMLPTFLPHDLLKINGISKRFDHLLPDGNDIVKEHAKLVQDINSLRQVLFIPPIADDNKDYEDSIFHEIIETSTTTTPKPIISKTVRPSPTKSIPVILVGGASQRQAVKTQPLKLPKPTISLVGTSISPIMKHPYPFVMAGKKPVKVCMTTLPMPMMYMATTPRPSLWQRLLSSLIRR